MKQHITVEQLNELSDKARERLGKCWVTQGAELSIGYCIMCKNISVTPEGGLLRYCYSNQHPMCKDCVKKKKADIESISMKRLGFVYNPAKDIARCSHNRENCVLPLLSIGQMIEFLNDKSGWYIRIGHAGQEAKYESGKPYSLDNGWEVGNYAIDEVFSESYFEGELCDALWKAVKHVLNETK